MANFIKDLGDRIEELTSREDEEELDEETEEEDEEEEDGINPYLIIAGAAAVAGGGYLAWRHFHPKEAESDEGEKDSGKKKSWADRKKEQALKKAKDELEKHDLTIVKKTDFEEFQKWKESQNTEENKD